MLTTINLTIQGLGIIVYSPRALAHIPPGSDYLSSRFLAPTDVAHHVMDCHLTGFCTGSPGDYILNVSIGHEPDAHLLSQAHFAIRLGLEVEGETVCFRDLYDLLDWNPDCPPTQSLGVPDGFHRITILSSPPPSGILGDGQVVHLWFEPVPTKPILHYHGVPMLCPCS